MKKMMILMLTLLIWGAASMRAQVAIGAGTGVDGGPTNGAVLELDGAQGALLLPRVDTLDITTPVAGMQVYRSADNRVYVYNGLKWVANADGQSSVLPGTATNQGLAWNGSNWAPRRLPYTTIFQGAGGTNSNNWEIADAVLNAACLTGFSAIPLTADVRNASIRKNAFIWENADRPTTWTVSTIDGTSMTPTYIWIRLLCY
jgi:hypothetical protein